eukprot:493589_1
MFFNGIYKYIMNRSIYNHNNNNNNDTTTCLMVINSHLHLLKYFDEIIIMDDGEIKVHCSINDLYFNEKNNNLLQQFQHLLPNYDSIVVEEKEEEEQEEQSEEYENESVHINDGQINDIPWMGEDDNFIPNWRSLLEFSRSSLIKFDYKSYWNDELETIKDLEIKSNSKQKLLLSILPLIVCIIIQCGAPMCDLWILYWNQNVENESLNDDLSTTQSNSLWYLSIWFVLIIIIGFATLFSMYLLGRITLKAAHHIHSKSLYNVLRANVLFFDVTPRGDILDRFSKDTQRMDINFTESSYQFILWISSLTGYLILIIVFIPYSILP